MPLRCAGDRESRYGDSENESGYGDSENESRYGVRVKMVRVRVDNIDMERVRR